MGYLSLMVSDAMIAYNKFIAVFPNNQWAIMATYYAAVSLLALSQPLTCTPPTHAHETEGLLV